MSLSANTLRPRALDGIRVLDLTRLLPGAFCSLMLADNGAEVIKVEQPGVGDYNRSFAPINKHESGSFLLLNRNKKSLTLNLKKDAGKDILLRLAAQADVLIEGFRPGVMARLGLDYERLRQINARLVYCSISGFGQTGPYSQVAAHDLNYMGIAGALQLFETRDGEPQVPGLSIADVGGGSLMAAFAITAALIARSAQGGGQYIDISMTDGLVPWLCYHGADYLFAGVEPRGGHRPFLGRCACYNVYRCGDGKWLTLGIIEHHFWERFCTLVDRPAYVDNQWPDGDAAARQRQDVAEIFLGRSRNEWLTLLAERDVPAGPVNSFAEAFADAQLRHRDMLLEVEHPVEGRIPQLGFPIKFSATPSAITHPPPLLGQHSEEILGGLGFNGEQIALLRREGVT